MRVTPRRAFRQRLGSVLRILDSWQSDSVWKSPTVFLAHRFARRLRHKQSIHRPSQRRWQQRTVTEPDNQVWALITQADS